MSVLTSSSTTATLSSTADSSSSRSRSTTTAVADTSDLDTVNDAETIADKQQGIVYQYYFLILVLGVILFIGILFFMRRRRNRRKVNAANLGRHALARDLESWRPTYRQQQAPVTPPTTARRWMQRYNRFAMRHPNRIPEEDENGLNEFGEAPPPYKPGKAGLDSDALQHRRDSHADAATTAAMPAVPLRTLSRNAAGKPPGYEEALRPFDSTSSLPVDQLPSTPETRRTDAYISTTDLLPRRHSQSQSHPPTNNTQSQSQSPSQLTSPDSTLSSNAKSVAKSSTTES